MIYVDRSRRDCAEKCLRKRYWNYEYKGRGIVPRGEGRSRFALTTGTGVHNGVEALVLGSTTDEAVAAGIGAYDGFDCGEDERGAYLLLEQKALIEGLVRAFAHTALPSFLDTYEVLHVEREYTVELAPDITWMSRPDLVVRRKSDGALFIVNLKTTKRVDERWVAQWPLDQQTLSEVIAAEAEMKEKFSGVIVLGLVKGETLEYPRGSGQWYHNSPLTQAWQQSSTGFLQARYEWVDANDERHRLGKGWKKVPVWEQEGGVKVWVGGLAQDDPALLAEQIVMLPPILRNDYQVEAWKISTTSQEHNIKASRNVLGRPHSDHALDNLFPMATSSGNCLWPVKCSYFGLCHENADPEDGERWAAREFNHPVEGGDGE